MKVSGNYFDIREISCKHCGQVILDWEFVMLLNRIRGRVGEPLRVNSWYRCEAHDAELDGGGNHTTGRAVDLHCDSSHLRFKLLVAALAEGVTRIGIGKTFIHLDICEDKEPEVTWLY